MNDLGLSDVLDHKRVGGPQLNSLQRENLGFLGELRDYVENEMHCMCHSHERCYYHICSRFL